MSDNQVAVADSFLPTFFNEELIIVDEKFQTEQSEKLESLGQQPAEESNSVIPALIKRNLVILQFHQPGKAISQYRNFIGKVLAAVNVKPDEIDIVDISKMEGMNARTVIAKSKARYILTFGVGEEPVTEIKLFKHDGRKVIVASPIEILSDDKGQKLKLWSLLKVMYQID